MDDLPKSGSRRGTEWLSALLLLATAGCLDPNAVGDGNPGYRVSYPTYVAMPAGTIYALSPGIDTLASATTSPTGIAEVDVRASAVTGLSQGFARWDPRIQGYPPMWIAVLNRTRAGPILVGHHGVPSLAPENTLAGIRLACDLGIPGIEVDVRFTKDSVPVLMHDRDVKRTSNGTGYVDQMTLDELERLDVGSWFGPKFAGERVPKLSDFLTVSAACGFDQIQLDTKSFTPLGGDSGLIRIAREVKQKGLFARAFLSSDLNTVKRGASLIPGLHTLVYVYGGIMSGLSADSLIQSRVDAVAISFSIYQASSVQLARLHLAGLVIGVWNAPTVLSLNALNPAPDFVTSDWGWRFVN